MASFLFFLPADYAEYNAPGWPTDARAINYGGCARAAAAAKSTEMDY